MRMTSINPNLTPADYPQPAQCPIKSNRLDNTKQAAESVDIAYAVWHKNNGQQLKRKYRPGI